MRRFAKTALTALALVAGSAGMALSTSAPAQAGVAVGVTVGGPVYWGPRYYGYHPCWNRNFRYWHPYRCHVVPRYYGPAWAGYYDSGYWGPGYYQPVIGGFWFTDAWGHRRWHRGDFDGYGFHRGRWHEGWRHWHGERDHDRWREHGRR